MYLTTNYDEFINLKLNETEATATKINTMPIDFNKINNLKKKKIELQKKLSIADSSERPEIEKQIKINDLRLIVAETK